MPIDITPEEYLEFKEWKDTRLVTPPPPSRPTKVEHDPRSKDFAYLYHLIPLTTTEWDSSDLLSFWEPIVDSRPWTMSVMQNLIKRRWVEKPLVGGIWKRNPADILQTNARCEAEYYLSGVPQKGPFYKPEYAANMGIVASTAGTYLRRMVGAEFVQGEKGATAFSKTVWRITRKGLELYNELFRGDKS